MISRLLGLRTDVGNVIIDPVLPRDMDGITAYINFLGYPITFSFAVKERTFSPKAISINGKDVNFAFEENIYRQGGAILSKDTFLSLLNEKHNTVNIEL